MAQDEFPNGETAFAYCVRNALRRVPTVIRLGPDERERLAEALEKAGEAR